MYSSFQVSAHTRGYKLGVRRIQITRCWCPKALGNDLALAMRMAFIGGWSSHFVLYNTDRFRRKSDLLPEYLGLLWNTIFSRA